MRGLDVVAQARTGSGKTLAYVLPMLVHLLDQPALAPGDGPIAIILAPTRELAAQIHRETRKFAKRVNVRVGAVYGGKNRYDQAKEIKAGVEVVVATPGGLIHMIRKGALSMRRVTYMVLDEADRMLDLGFEPRCGPSRARPAPTGRPCCSRPRSSAASSSSSATSSPARSGSTSARRARPTPTSSRWSTSCGPDADKWPWLMENLSVFAITGQVLIFVSTKNGCELLSRSLEGAGFVCGALHGDKAQADAPPSSTRSAPVASASWWPPTWRRAASTSPPSARWSTTTWRATSTPTSTAWAERAAPASRAWPTRSSPATNRLLPPTSPSPSKRPSRTYPGGPSIGPSP